MTQTEVKLDQQTLIETYQPLIGKESFSKRQFFELCRDVLRARGLRQIILVGEEIDVEVAQQRPEEITVNFIRIDSETGKEDTSERWEISSTRTEARGRQHFNTSFYFRSGVTNSLVAGEVSRLGHNVPEVNLKLTNTHIFKLAKTVWDANLNFSQD